MNKLLSLFFIILFFSNCKKNINCNIDYSVLKTNDSIISKYKSDSGEWWKNYLTKSREPDLINTDKKEYYRLSIYDVMYNKSKIYSTYNENGSYKLIYKVFDGKKEQLESFQEFDLTNNEWKTFKKIMKEINFWNLPVTINRKGLDGTSWVFEANNPKKENCTNRKYHIVSRWEPLDSMKIMKLNYKLIELAKK